MDITRRRHAVLLALALTVGSASLVGCVDQYTDDQPVAIESPTSATNSPAIAALEADPASIGPVTDADATPSPDDPSAVASAFVLSLVNRDRATDPLVWIARVQRWTTADLAGTFHGRGRTNVLGQTMDDRQVESVGSVVGIAPNACSVSTCHVSVVADETLIIDGHRLDERNFVSWELDLEHDDTRGWLVARVSFGTGS